MKRIGAFVLLAVMLLAAGCRSSAEIDDYSYAMMIGVDKAETAGEYLFTYRVILPQAFAGEGKAKEEDKAKLVSVRASSLSASFKEVSLAMNRRLNATHIVGFVFSEEVARSGVYAIVSAMNKSVLFRNSVMLVVCEDSARDFIARNQAPFEVFPSRWMESLRDNQSRNGAYFAVDAREFYRRLREPCGAGALTLARSSDSEAWAVGSAVFADWKMVGRLTREESFGGVLLQKVLRAPIDVTDPEDAGSVYSLGVRTFEPTIDVALEGGRMTADLTIEGTAELMEMAKEPSDLDVGELYPRLERELNRRIECAVMSYLTQTRLWGADAVGIRDRYRRHCATYSEWGDLDWQTLYRDADIQVRAQITIKRRDKHTRGGDALAL